MSTILILKALPVIIIIYTLLKATWRIYLQPLRHIPGPRSWIGFPILRHISAIQGNLDADIRRFHAQFGDVVRVGPAEVSFITPDAWKPIYGHNNNQPQLPKVITPGSTEIDIISANDANHARYRRALAHAFSARGLQAQEPVLRVYVDKLVERLKGVAESRLPVDMVKWYNLTTFDLIGDLAFGEPFGGLDNSGYHYWVSTIFDFLKIVPFRKIKGAYPALFPLLALFLPKGLLQAREKQAAYARDTVQRRLRNEAAYGRGDFMDSMLRHRGEKDGLSDAELEANATMLIVAGSETTATLLSGVTYWLLKYPEVLKKVTDEVRSAMATEEDINLNTVATHLPYMLACLEEGSRMYPAVPSGQPRRTLTPTIISGYNIPPDTTVSVHQSAAYSSPTNFTDPHRFIPERWLPDAKTNPSSPFFSDRRDVLQPFSIGPRNCIGRNLAYAEMRVILARVLWNFDLSLCEGSEGWVDQKSYVLWDKGPLMCWVRVRD